MTDVAAVGSRASLRVERVAIRNFRGLTTELELEPTLTVLVARNNGGKSRILRAIGLALGDGRAELDDLTVGSEEPATVDVVVAPVVDAGMAEVFEQVVEQVVGPDIISQDPEAQRFAWRLTVKRSVEGEGARAEFARLAWDGSAWTATAGAKPVSQRQELQFVAAGRIDTQRDLSEEQTRRGTAIRRLLAQLGIPAEEAGTLLEELRGLGERIVDTSASLTAIREALEGAHDRVGGFGEVGLNALPVSLEELARAVSFDLDSGAGGGMLPMRMHGSGPRSLASILVQGVYYDRLLGADRPELLPHPVSLIEEPEAHLHPQMQVELPALLTGISGQVVVSTHSATLVSEVDHEAVRLLLPIVGGSGGAVRTVDLKAAPVAATEVTEDGEEVVETADPAVPRLRQQDLHNQEIEKVKRLVERPFGEILFASAIVIGDGATERGFLPPVLRHALGSIGHGVVVVDPGAMSNALPLVKLAEAIGVPWYLFADGDKQGAADVRAICTDARVNDPLGAPRFIEVTPNGATEVMLVQHCEDLCRRVAGQIRPDLVGSTDSALVLLGGLKGSAGPALGRAFVQEYPNPDDWPDGLRTLVETLKKALRPEVGDGDNA